MNGKKGQLEAGIVIIIIIIIIIWIIVAVQKECNEDSDCGSDSYCTSEFTCNKIPVIEKTTLSVNKNYGGITAGIIFLGIAIMVAAWILNRSDSAPVEKTTQVVEKVYHTPEKVVEKKTRITDRTMLILSSIAGAVVMCIIFLILLIFFN
ncbi:hypothetical protein ACFLTH_17425 [Bacteroidota bacterium]